MFLRLLGLPLGLPLEIILLDWTKSNYSQSRAVLEQAYQVFIGWQKLLEDFFYVSILEWQISLWIEAGEIKERPDGLNHEWIKPSFPWIDQYKEALAQGEKIDRGFGTYAQVCKSLNMDRLDVLGIREQEIRDAIKRAKGIEEDTQVKVPWQLFAGFKVPKEEKNQIVEEKE